MKSKTKTPRSSPKSPRSWTWRRSLVFAIVTVALFFALAESVVRLAGFDAWQLDFSVYRGVPGDITPNQRVDYRFRNFDHRYSITINEQGLREPSRLRGRPFRVLCVGDSNTLGFGVEDHETFPAQLQRYLDGHYGSLFDVINAGVVGYTIDDEIEYLMEKGFALEPSVVVLEVFWNDVLEKSIRHKSSQREHSKKRWPYMRPASWAMDSALYQAIRNKFLWMEVARGDFPELPTDKLQVAMEPDAHVDYWSLYDGQFMFLADECRQRGIPLVVTVTPHQYQVFDWNFPAWDYAGADGFQRHIESLSAKAGAQFVDLMPVYRREAREYPSLYLSEGLYDEHVGPIGQWIKAREVFAALAEGPMRGTFHNLYNDTIEGQLHLTHGLKPGRLWRPRDDNGGLFFRRGGVATVAIPRDAASARDFAFSAGLATIGPRQSGVSLLIYDAEIADSDVASSPSLRVLSEFPPLAFPLSDDIAPVRVELNNLMGNALLLVVDEPLSIQGAAGMEQKLRQLPLTAPTPDASDDLTSSRPPGYFYFLRQPLIYPRSMTGPITPAEAAAPDK